MHACQGIERVLASCGVLASGLVGTCSAVRDYQGILHVECSVATGVQSSILLFGISPEQYQRASGREAYLYSDYTGLSLQGSVSLIEQFHDSFEVTHFVCGVGGTTETRRKQD